MSRSTRSGPPRTVRRVPAPLSYLPAPRVLDRFAGRGLDAAAVADLHRTGWAQRITQTYLENDARLLLASQAAVEAEIRTLLTVGDELRELAEQRRRLDRQLQELVPPDLGVRGDAEEHLSQAAVASRRRREHEVVRARLTGELDRVTARERECRAQVHVARATVTEEFETARTRSLRLRHFYSRRLATFARSAARSAGLTTAPLVELPLSTWAQGPCPWVPAPYAEALDDDPVTQPAVQDMTRRAA